MTKTRRTFVAGDRSFIPATFHIIQVVSVIERPELRLTRGLGGKPDKIAGRSFRERSSLIREHGLEGWAEKGRTSHDDP
jgi:hypothetical protein